MRLPVALTMPFMRIRVWFLPANEWLSEEERLFVAASTSEWMLGLTMRVRLFHSLTLGSP
jgi:hypothetical protein